jgi:hypothetical protein
MKALFALCALFAVIAAASAAYCSTCGGASYTDISKACSQFSGWSQSCCQCIAQHESGGNLHACNQNTDGSKDVGLWQINDRNWSACNGGSAPCDLSSNLRCAIDVWKWGSGMLFSPLLRFLFNFNLFD